VLFEEADGLSSAAQKALRSLIDDSSDTTRFIFTCNYVNKIIPPLQSRFQNIHIDSFDEEALALHAASILEGENITYDPDTLIDHVEKYQPDMRKIINSLQGSSISGTLTSPNASSSDDDDFMEMWAALWSRKSSYSELVKYVSMVDNNNFEQVYEVMYSSDSLTGSNAIPIIAEHLYKAYTVSNQTINIDACLIRLFNDL
jgi:DNA polymerase III delta prime subunit